MSTNYYIVNKQVFEFYSNLEFKERSNYMHIVKAHVARLGGGWKFQAYIRGYPVDKFGHDAFNHQLCSTELFKGLIPDTGIESVADWKAYLSQLPDSLVVINEYDDVIDPAELISWWEEDSDVQSYQDLRGFEIRDSEGNILTYVEFF